MCKTSALLILFEYKSDLKIHMNRGYYFTIHYFQHSFQKHNGLWCQETKGGKITWDYKQVWLAVHERMHLHVFRGFANPALQFKDPINQFFFAGMIVT